MPRQDQRRPILPGRHPTVKPPSSGRRRPPLAAPEIPRVPNIPSPPVDRPTHQPPTNQGSPRTTMAAPHPAEPLDTAMTRAATLALRKLACHCRRPGPRWRVSISRLPLAASPHDHPDRRAVMARRPTPTLVSPCHCAEILPIDNARMSADPSATEHLNRRTAGQTKHEMVPSTPAAP